MLFGLHTEGKNALQCLSDLVWAMQTYRQWNRKNISIGPKKPYRSSSN